MFSLILNASKLFGLIVVIFTFSLTTQAESRNWVKVKAKNKYERSHLANLGVVIESIEADHIEGFVNDEELKALEKTDQLAESVSLRKYLNDFPPGDGQFNTYKEIEDKIFQWQTDYPNILSVETIGSSHEGRSIYNLRISTDLDNSEQKPGIIFLGGHHAREHISVEMALGLIEYLLTNYNSKNQKVTSLIQNREIHVVPVVNPDGVEYDVSGNRYH